VRLAHSWDVANFSSFAINLLLKRHGGNFILLTGCKCANISVHPILWIERNQAFGQLVKLHCNRLNDLLGVVERHLQSNWVGLVQRIKHFLVNAAVLLQQLAKVFPDSFPILLRRLVPLRDNLGGFFVQLFSRFRFSNS